MDLFATALEHFEDEDYAQALVVCEEGIKQHPEDINFRMLEIMLYEALGHISKSFDLLKKIPLPTEEGDTLYQEFYYRQLGDAYKYICEYEKAHECFDKVIEFMPKEASSYIFKGVCYSEEGKLDLARQLFLKATKKEGVIEEAYFNLALLSRAEGDFEAAKKHCKMALKIDVAYADAFEFLEDIEAALELSKQFSKHRPNQVSL